MRAQVRVETEPPAAPVVKAAEAAYHDPAWVVQRAWSVFRLPRLQELIRLTIVDLQALPPISLAGHELGGGSPEVEQPGCEQPACDPVAEALRACCEELRDAAAMPGASEARANHCKLVRDYMAQQPSAWSEVFVAALQEYRKTATRALESAFTRALAA
jgi:hypothetical protein